MPSKLMFGLAVSAIVGLAATNGFAQSCECGSASTSSVSMPETASGLTYQRYSYQPSATISPQTFSGVIQRQTFISSAPALTQNYRRFSYQPSMSSRSSQKSPWEYSKADPRRQASERRTNKPS